MVIATLRGCLHKLELGSGRLVWTQELGFPVFASPLLLSDHRLLVATVEGALLTLDIVTGTVVTKLPTPGRASAASHRFRFSSCTTTWSITDVFPAASRHVDASPAVSDCVCVLRSMSRNRLS